MKTMKSLYLLCFLTLICTNQSVHCQDLTAQKETITKSFADYFFLERENIHLHLDKNVFLTNEEIWFKGYVFHRKNNLPFLITSNVYAVLIDQEGKKMSQKLLFANNGTFSGNFKLDATFKSGVYYIQLYTNWMNNFTEDESSVYKINIINEATPYYLDYTTPNYEKINVDFHPEGGNFIEGVSNAVGIQLSDCFGNPIPHQPIEIKDAKNETIRNFTVNSLGFGKFDLTPNNETYTAVFFINDKKIETVLPKAVSNGIALEVNNFAVPNKTVIKIKTNAQTIASFANKPLLLVLQQDDKSTIIDVNFENEKTETELIISNDLLYEGTNTIRIIDANLNQMAERIVFKYPKETTQLDIKVESKTDNSVTVSGNLNFPNANFSVAILPENSKASNTSSVIYGAFLLQPYLSDNVFNAKYYFTNQSKAKHYELDLMLLNQKSSKYNWQNTLSNPPKITHEFDIGLTIKGGINQIISDKSKYKIQLYSITAQLNEFSEINAQNEFYFKNMVVGDGTFVDISLLKYNDLQKPLPLKMYAKIIDGNRTFKYPFQPKPFLCELKTKSASDFEMPEFQKNIVYLENVEVESKFKLKRQMQFGNSSLRGYKIIAENNNLTVVNFIQQNGFDTFRDRGEVGIFGRSRTTINGQRSSPVVYLDNVLLLTFDELWDLQMEDIDEIYINAQAIVPSVTNNIGIIKIYRKKLKSSDIKPTKDESKELMIENGFAEILPFKNAEYNNNGGDGFDNLGLIHWIPTVLSEVNGSFKFQFPSGNEKNIKLLIEGFTSDGKLISEIITLSL